MNSLSSNVSNLQTSTAPIRSFSDLRYAKMANKMTETPPDYAKLFEPLFAEKRAFMAKGGYKSVKAQSCFGTVSVNDKVTPVYEFRWYGCYGSLAATYFNHSIERIKKNENIFLLSLYNGCMSEPDVGKNTDMSRPWLEFLMGENSPWKGLHDHIVVKDLDYILNNGFIFGNLLDIPLNLLYNFLMATRVPGDRPTAYQTFLDLRDKMPVNEAAFLCTQVGPVMTPLKENEHYFDRDTCSYVYSKPTGQYSIGNRHPNAHLYAHDPRDMFTLYTAGTPRYEKDWTIRNGKLIRVANPETHVMFVYDNNNFSWRKKTKKKPDHAMQETFDSMEAAHKYFCEIRDEQLGV